MYREGVFVAALFNYTNYNIEFLVCQHGIQRILWSNKRLYVCTNVTLLYYVKYTKEIKMVEYNPVKRLKTFVFCGVFDFMTSFHD